MTSLLDRVFYSIYPLGYCGAKRTNDFCSPAGDGLRFIQSQIPYLVDLGINALYIGPLFESTSHGYDTLDYWYVDRRLGNNEDLKALVEALHHAGIIVILDGVFNHTGRHFFAFTDIQQHGSRSAYTDWYKTIDFSQQSPQGDSFRYEGWHGCFDLVALNQYNREVRDHLLQALRHWILDFGIDGLRLDAAELLLPDFMDEIASCCKGLKENFWLLGEVVAGDYRAWAHEGRLDGVTNYELYKSLWSSLNDRNFFELSWTLEREWGEKQGLYKTMDLFNFADNHDVARAASILKKPSHLFPLYGLLYTLPGIPSLYYGSEFGIPGEKTWENDYALRPSWKELHSRPRTASQNALAQEIKRFIAIRKQQPPLQWGSYRQLYLASEQFAFIRELPGHTALPALPESETPSGAVVIAVNSAEAEQTITLDGFSGETWRDLLSGEVFQSTPTRLSLPLQPSWLRILRSE